MRCWKEYLKEGSIFHTSVEATEAAKKLHGQIMPKTGLVVSAVTDNSCELVFTSDVYKLVEASVREAISTCDGVSIKVEEKKGS